MENLKYTKTEDIIKFLETIGYDWTGKYPKNLSQSFEDFPNGVSVIACDKERITHVLNLRVTDTSFLTKNENSIKKIDFNDLSFKWQLFMLKRKGKRYAKLLYTQSLKINEETKKQYDKKISLLVKRAEKLSYARNLKISHSNTILINAASKLSQEEIEKLKSECEL